MTIILCHKQFFKNDEWNGAIGVLLAKLSYSLPLERVASPGAVPVQPHKYLQPQTIPEAGEN